MNQSEHDIMLHDSICLKKKILHINDRSISIYVYSDIFKHQYWSAIITYYNHIFVNPNHTIKDDLFCGAEIPVEEQLRYLLNCDSQLIKG